MGSIIQLFHAIGLSVVAEGVETEEQRRLLAGLGCGMAQGFLLGRPASAEVVESVLVIDEHPFDLPGEGLGAG